MHDILLLIIFLCYRILKQSLWSQLLILEIEVGRMQWYGQHNRCEFKPKVDRFLTKMENSIVLIIKGTFRLDVLVFEPKFSSHLQPGGCNCQYWYILSDFVVCVLSHLRKNFYCGKWKLWRKSTVCLGNWVCIRRSKVMGIQGLASFSSK